MLLQSCEQVPKRRHSLMSGGYTGRGGGRCHGASGCRPAPSESRLPTLASGVARHNVEARAAGAVGGFLGAHAAGLIPADAGVGGAAGQLGVCGGQSGSPALSRPGPGASVLCPATGPRPPAPRRAYRCCIPPRPSRPRSHPACCNAARRTGSAGSGTETPSCLCSGGSGPWGALGKAGSSDLAIHHPTASSHRDALRRAVRLRKMLAKHSESQSPPRHLGARKPPGLSPGPSLSQGRAPGLLAMDPPPSRARSSRLAHPPGPCAHPNYGHLPPAGPRPPPLARRSPQSSSSVPSPQLSVPSHWRPIHRQTRSFLQRKGRLGGHTNRAAAVGADRARISLGGGLGAPGERESPAPAPGPRPPPHRTPPGFRRSCRRSRPRRRTSRPAACTACCCTGTRPGGRSALGRADGKEPRMSPEPQAGSPRQDLAPTLPSRRRPRGMDRQAVVQPE